MARNDNSSDSVTASESSGEFKPPKSSNETSVPAPLAAIQALYYSVTGKTDNIMHTSDKNFLIDWNEIQQLKDCIDQQIEHHRHLGPTYTILVRYAGGISDRYSSWEKFSTIDQTTRNTIIELNIKAEFATILDGVTADTSKTIAQRYVIDINLISKSSIELSNTLGIPRKFIIRELPTIFIRIDYVDYVFAKNLLSTIQDWIRNTPSVKNNWHFPLLQTLSHHFAFLFTAIGTLSALLPCYYLAVDQDIYNNPSIGDLVSWGLWSVGIVVSTRLLFRFFAEIVEYRVDKTQDISCIAITRGDHDVLQKKQLENRRHIISVIKWLFLTIAATFVAGFSNYIISLLF